MRKVIKKKPGLTSAVKDSIALTVVVTAVFILSYFFSVFDFLIVFVQKHPSAIFFIDEVVSVLLALSIGLTLFSLRRQQELKSETAERIKLQEKLTNIANIKAQTERIVSKQLQDEIELRKSLER